MHSQDLNKEDVWSVYAPNQPVSFPLKPGMLIRVKEIKLKPETWLLVIE